MLKLSAPEDNEDNWEEVNGAVKAAAGNWPGLAEEGNRVKPTTSDRLPSSLPTATLAPGEFMAMAQQETPPPAPQRADQPTAASLALRAALAAKGVVPSVKPPVHDNSVVKTVLARAKGTIPASTPTMPKPRSLAPDAPPRPPLHVEGPMQPGVRRYMERKPGEGSRTMVPDITITMPGKGRRRLDD